MKAIRSLLPVTVLQVLMIYFSSTCVRTTSAAETTNINFVAEESKNDSSSSTSRRSESTSLTSDPATDTKSSQSQSPPNLIVIMTDQHSYRTLGCYRDYLISKNQTEQAYVWGPNITVETPHLDRLAAEGALFTNFHSTVPLCTPNRASFVSGLYPSSTGADQNHLAMNEDVITFAQILRDDDKTKYNTAYFGKWHLNGRSKPGLGDMSPFYDFGFTHKKFLFNQGHWKWMDVGDDGNPRVYEYDEGKKKFKKKEQNYYMTDYLFRRTIDFMKEHQLNETDSSGTTTTQQQQQQQQRPFAAFLSIPDPHPPKSVRSPYDTIYNETKFQLPYTARTAAEYNPATPGWNIHEHLNVPLNYVDGYLSKYENQIFYQDSLQQYFGMIKCIDDNVGRLLWYLKQSGLDDNTVIAFTSDHGDMLGEHGKFNKNRPYRTSAGIPFIIRHPNAIKAGKVVETAYTSVDFAPTILSYLGVTNHSVEFEGIDFSDELSSDEMHSNKDDVVRFTYSVEPRANWAAAIMKQYRLVLSKRDVPWLFDLDQDPYEIHNYFDKIDGNVQQRLMDSLLDAMPKFKIAMDSSASRVFLSMPTCKDSRDRIAVKGKYRKCEDLGVHVSMDKCSSDRFQNRCPITCDSPNCCVDSSGYIKEKEELLSCEDFAQHPRRARLCKRKDVKLFCPVTCRTCKPEEV